MAGSDTDDAAESRANADDDATPTRRRRKPLDSMDAVRREMVRMYWELKEGKVDLDKGKGLIYVLGKVVEVLKAEKGDEAELLALLQKLKGKLG